MIKDHNRPVVIRKEELKKYASNIITMHSPRECIYPNKHLIVKSAALFPFNKEMHILARLRNTLSFKVSGIYDVRYSGRVGSKCDKFIGNENTENSGCPIIEDVRQLRWDEIDTIVVGHCDELNESLGMDIRYRLIKDAIQNRVNIYSFDSLSGYDLTKTQQNIQIYWPEISESDIPFEQSNKLYAISKPVVGIFGTSSRQGKYTLLVSLRERFWRDAYNVGCISTEPNGALLGMDCLPLGYKAEISVSEQQLIQIVNKKVHDLCLKNDIILTSGQANSIPFTTFMPEMFPVKQHPFILGVQPDAALLCVNSFDSPTYIRDTVKYLEGAGQCMVIGLVLFPMAYYDDWRSYHESRRKMDKIQIDEACRQIEKDINIPCYVLNSDKSIDLLYTAVINHLSEEPKP